MSAGEQCRKITIWGEARRPLGMEIAARGPLAADRQQTRRHSPVLLRGVHTDGTIAAVLIRSINDPFNLLMALTHRLKGSEQGVQRSWSRVGQVVT